jgi:hypothetical protein
MGGYLHTSLGYGDLFVLTWFVASAATVGGALGAGLESDEAIRGRVLEARRGAPRPARTRTDLSGRLTGPSRMLHRPDDLDDDEQRDLARVLDACPRLNATAPHVRAFARSRVRGDAHRPPRRTARHLDAAGRR